MSDTCNRCTLLTAMAKMTKSEHITASLETTKEIIKQFINGEITFKDVGDKLGLNVNEMLKYITEDSIDRYINGTNTK